MSDETVSDTDEVLPIPVGLKKVHENVNLYESTEIMKCIEQRFISSKKSTLLHRACVYIPISAAFILKQNPQLIAYAVRAFCNRDPIDLKSCRAMKHFPPETRVYTQITFTKCLYALLTYHSYKPSQRTGWNLPNENHETFSAHNLGMKIACGLEICVSKLSNERNNVENTKEWQIFSNQLKQNGYFGDAIDGSREFTQRLDTAKQYFRILSENHSTYIDAVAQEIHQHLKDMSNLNDQYKTDVSSEYNASLNDTDDWMNISQDEFDNMMSERYGIKKTLRLNTDDSENDVATDFGMNLNTFLTQKSEFDGVDFRPLLKDEPISAGTSKNTQHTGNNIDFNADAFQAHVKDMLDFVIPEDNWDSHSDSMSDFDEENIERDMMSKSNVAAISAYMEQMDRELAATTIGSSFKCKPNESNLDDDEDFDDVESFEPVDIDCNALKNLAESYKAQYGNHGPTTSLLNSLGMRLNADKSQGPQRPSPDDNA